MDDTRLHIGIVSVLFDAKPEGVCTGRLLRALLEAGFKVTLFTSDKAKLGFSHDNLIIKVISSKPREPRSLFKLIARLSGQIPNNFYIWGRRVAKQGIDSSSDTGSDSNIDTADMPDVIYGRAWPHASLVAAYQLAIRHTRPLILHFSDPFPPPNESLAKPQFMQDLQQMLDYASALTITNAETIEYQSRYLSLDSDKAHVLPHVAPPAKQYLDSVSENRQFHYIGSAGHKRPMDLLLAGFKLHLQQHAEDQLIFVGTEAALIEPLIKSLGISAQVEIMPFSNQLDKFIAQSSGLIAVDTNVADPIYTPTKIVEYLNTNKKVLAITPDGSPVQKLLRECSQTSVVVADYHAEAVATGFSNLASLAPQASDYDSRFALMQPFSASSVASRFADICAGLNLKK